MKIDMHMSIFVESSDSKQAICPDKHNSYQSQSVKTEFHWIQRYIVFELTFQLMFFVQYFRDQLIVHSADNSKNSSHQTIELAFIDSNSILEVVYNEDEDRREETDCMDYRQRQIKLSCTHSQTMQDHNKVTFKKIIKIYIILEVQCHVVVSRDDEIQYYRGNTSDQ